MSPLPLLRHAADVTPEWMTDALEAAGVLGGGARVTSFETRPVGTGQMADTTRFSLAYDAPGAGPGSVVGNSPRPTSRAAAPAWHCAPTR